MFKTLIGAKPLCTRLDNVDGFIRVYGAIRYTLSFGGEKYDFLYNRIVV